MKRLGTALAVCVTLSSATAFAADPPERIVISDGINADGSGHLIANPVPDGSWGSISWAACAPDGACQPVQSPDSRGRFLDVGDATPGTTFVATASDGTQSISGSSTAYRGRLALFSPPSIIGSPRAGHFVMPVPGMWLGGWGDEKPLVQLQVCRTRRSASCRVIATTFYWEKCPGTGARIASRYVGWYLRVAETRVGKDVVFAARAYTRPEDIRPMTESVITAIATIGRIQPGRGPNRRCQAG